MNDDNPVLVLPEPARRVWLDTRDLIKEAISSECFSRCRCLHRPLRLLPAGATVAGRDSHPLRNGAFHGAHRIPRYPTLPASPLGGPSTGVGVYPSPP